MKKHQIIQAWRDENYLLSLSEAERTQLPANPVGAVEIADETLMDVAGGSHYCDKTHVFSECYQTCDSCYSGGGSLCCC